MKLNPTELELAQALDDMDQHLLHRVYLDPNTPTDFMIDNYVRLVGFRKHHHLKMLRRALVERIGRDAFDEHWQLARQHFPKRYGEYEKFYFERIEHPQRAVVVIEEGPNELFETGFPHSQCLGNRKREAVKIYSAVGAELFSDGGMFQVHGRNPESAWATANPFGLTRQVRRFPAQVMQGSVVFVGDIYDGTNFCHFLFDRVTRIGHAIERGLIDPHAQGSEAVSFVLNARPGEFHRLIIDALSQVYHVDSSKFLFPISPTCYQPSGAVSWFSDAFEHDQIPAQLMHPSSQAILRKVANAIDIPPGPHKRLYISRADAAHRRVVNEEELMSTLTPRGFKLFTLGALPVAEQIAIIRGAQIIVAPHGMGLTHCAFHQGGLRLIELVNPRIGMDAYAAMSRAFGFDYECLIGEALPNTLDFRVSPHALRALLD